MEKGYLLTAVVNHKDGTETVIEPLDSPILNGGAVEDRIAQILGDELASSFVFTVAVVGEFDFGASYD